MKPFLQAFVISIVILILVFSIFLLYLIFWDEDVKSNNNSNEGFEVIEGELTSKDVQNDKCETPDIQNICNNNIACCDIQNYSYFCKHPLVKLCSAELQNCVNNSSFKNLYPIQLRKDKCKNQLNACCKPFDSLSYDSSKFENIGNFTQKTDEIGNYLAINEKDREVCPKMCQTDENCKAFTLGLDGCRFYSNVNPMLARFSVGEKVSIDSSGKTGYFKKL
jgi:hypothetical protein